MFFATADHQYCINITLPAFNFKSRRQFTGFIRYKNLDFSPVRQYGKYRKVFKKVKI